MDAATFLSPVVTPQGSPAPADTSPAAAPQPEQPTLPNGVTATDVAASNALHEAVQNGVTDLAAEPNYIPTSNLQDQAEKRAREAKTSTLDYVTAAMHQDDFVNGLVASIAAPDSVDPNFNILDPKTYAQWTEGLPDSLKPEMLNVQSAAAAAYRRNL